MPIINKNNLKNTFSKLSNIAKDTAENVMNVTKEGASTVAKKSGELVEISKLNMNINSEEATIKTLYHKIGQVVFEKHEAGNYIDPELVEACNKILDIKRNISEMNEKISQLKNQKTCSACKSKLNLDVKFCSKCGAVQEVPDVNNIVEDEHTEKCNCVENEVCDCSTYEKETNCECENK